MIAPAAISKVCHRQDRRRERNVAVRSTTVAGIVTRDERRISRSGGFPVMIPFVTMDVGSGVRKLAASTTPEVAAMYAVYPRSRRGLRRIFVAPRERTPTIAAEKKT